MDRLLALWQSFWPGVWVTPAYSTGGTYMYDAGQPLNKTSPLYPFKFASGPSQVAHREAVYQKQCRNRSGTPPPSLAHGMPNDVLHGQLVLGMHTGASRGIIEALYIPAYQA